MVQKKVVILIILSLVFCVVPAWAFGNQTEEAIELIESSSVVPAGKEPVTPQPIAIPKNNEPAQSSAANADAAPSNTSWWGNFSDMVGLTDSDPGMAIGPTASQMAQSATDYIIGPGDIIGISVWKDESLTRTVVVLPDGKITFPLLGDLVAGGKTVARLKQELETGLTRYVADSIVTVEVKQSNSMIIYIVGRVNAPGRQVLVANTNVLQALAMAGGMNPFAKRKNIKIFRQEDGKTAMFLFDYNAVADGRHLEMNIELKRGDVIIVP